MKFSQIMVPIITGIASGMVRYLSASGMCLMMAGMGVINFGQGTFYVLGAAICLTVTQLTGNLFLGILAGTLVTFLLGAGLETMMKPILNKNIMLSLMLTMGVAYVLDDVMELIWGSTPKAISVPAGLRGITKIFGVPIPSYYLFIIGAALLVAIAFWIMFKKTRLGMTFRAIICDRTMTECLGVNVPLTYMLMFMIGIGLSGFGGGLYLPISALVTSSGLSAFADVIPIMIIGGMTNLQGAFPAAIIVGVLQALAARFAPSIYNAIPTLCMVICILFKPEGLFTKKAR